MKLPETCGSIRTLFYYAIMLIGADELRTLVVLQGGESDFVKRMPMIVAALDRGEVAQTARGDRKPRCPE